MADSKLNAIICGVGVVVAINEGAFADSLGVVTGFTKGSGPRWTVVTFDGAETRVSDVEVVASSISDFMLTCPEVRRAEPVKAPVKPEPVKAEKPRITDDKPTANKTANTNKGGDKGEGK